MTKIGLLRWFKLQVKVVCLPLLLATTSTIQLAHPAKHYFLVIIAVAFFVGDFVNRFHAASLRSYLNSSHEGVCT